MTPRPFHRPPPTPWETPAIPDPLPPEPPSVDDVVDHDPVGRLLMLLPGVVSAALFGLVSGNTTFATVSVMAALASMVVWRCDTARRRRVARRRSDERQRARAATEVEHVRRWRAVHEARADELRHQHPPLAELTDVVVRGDERLWQRRPGRHPDCWTVSTGRGRVVFPVDGTDAAVELDDVPQPTDLGPGVVVGVHGSAARSAARSMIVRLAVRSGPADWCLAAWPRSVVRTLDLAGLVHEGARAPHTVLVTDEPRRWVEIRRDRQSRCVVVVAPHRGQLPAECDVIVDSTDADLIEAGAADMIVRALSRWSDPEAPVDPGVDSVDDESPFSVVLGDDDRGRAVRIDIVRDGPHAVVVGCTGSGKSELLSRWVTELAKRVDPTCLNVLAVDYKGGSTSDGLAALPHTVGVLTDLDDATVSRVVAALRDEIRRREQRLRDLAVRSIDDCRSGEIPRLLVVVDEVAALRARSPELLQELLNVAQRGRSLGIHSILATQRPQSLTADILGNSDVRVVLRVLTTSDSVDLLGSEVAATFTRHRPGRAAVSCSGAEPVVFVGRRAEPEVHPRERATPLWLPPLPREPTAPHDHRVVAILDDVERRERIELRREGESWLIVGDPAARRVAVRALAERGDVVVVRADDCDAEIVHRTLSMLRSESARNLVIEGVDDIVTHQLCDSSGRHAWSRLERFVSIENPTAATVTCSRESSVPTILRDRCARVLRMVDRDGGFETTVDERTVFGRFVLPVNPRPPLRPTRFPTRYERADTFAVFVDDERPVSPPTREPWRVSIVGESGSGRTTALRALTALWHRERSDGARRLVAIDDDDVVESLDLDDVDLDVIAVIDPVRARDAWDHWSHALRRHRTGLLLANAVLEHPDVLGVAPPHRPHAITAGRGEWVVRGRAMGTVQVAV